MFVSEIIPNLWVCDYDVIGTKYFNSRNIGLYVHVYTFQNKVNLKINYNQTHIEIKIKDITSNMYYSNNEINKRQIMRYSKEFAESIYEHIERIHKFLKNMQGVVIYSKHGIQKAATVAAAYLILKSNVNFSTSINIMNSKEPLFFKDIENLDQTRYDNLNYILYEHTLKYIERY